MSRLPLLYNVRSLGGRWKLNGLAILGVALAAGALVVLIAMAAGLRTTLRQTGRADNAIVIQKGTSSEMTSDVSREHMARVAVDAAIARGADGQPLASPEIVVMTNLPRRDSAQTMNVLVRGVTPRAFEVRSGITLRSGRRIAPGLDEIMVGERLQGRVAGLELGDRVRVQGSEWRVVGTFASEGNGFESEVWADAGVVAGVFGRGGFQSLTVRLHDPDALPAFAKSVDGASQAQLEAKQERQYYDEQAGPLVLVMSVLTGMVCLIMGAGAALGAMNTMYATVGARTREIGTLRALGFPRRAVLAGFVAESTLLGLAGGTLGSLLAIPVNGLATATQGGSFTDLSFQFHITSNALLAGMAFGAAVGLFGGLLPALRAARLPIVAALREAT